MKILFLALLLALAGVLYWLSGMPDPAERLSRADATGKAPGSVDVAPVPALKPLSAYSAVSEKALFTRERGFRKAPVKKPRIQPARQPRLEVQALGIAVSDDGMLAVVKERRTGKIRRLRINEQISGWKLVSIASDGFSFEKSGKEIFVVFKNTGGGG